MIVENIFLIIVGASNLTLGFLVYLNNKKSLMNRAFSIWAFSLSLWSVSSFLFYVLGHPYYESLILGRFLYGTAIVIVAALLYFASIFPDNINLKKRKVISIFIPAALLLLLTISSDLIIFDVTSTTYGIKAVFGSLFGLYALFIIVYVSLSVFILAKKYRCNQDSIKSQIRYILIGITASGVLGITINIVLPIFGIFNIDKFGPVSTIVMVVFMAYAIAKHNVMNIKIIATQFFVIILSFLLFINVFLARDFKELIMDSFLFLVVASAGYLLAKSVSREVSTRQKLEDLTLKLQSANADLRKLDQAKSEFISIASHQLRTPLSIIKGYISVMLEGDMGKFTKEQSKYLDRVYESNERLIMLVNDLLDLSRIESGRIEYKFEYAAPIAFTENIVKDFEPKSAEKNISLEFKPKQDDFPFVYIDEENLRQAIANLIDNSIKYTDKGGVTVSLAVKGENVVWKIKDTGIGIDPKEKKRLFKKFARSERASASHAEGTGLGLYVAKRIVDSHRGNLRVESKGAGKGSTFYVSIPIRNKTHNT